ncbi:MAG: hypothetical protein QM718_11035 [Steroidobacteraceae bacterium]
MSGTVKKIATIATVAAAYMIGGPVAAGAAYYGSTKIGGKSADPLAKDSTPEVQTSAQVPLVDDTAQAQAETDRLRRRRGTLANIFAGSSSGSPSVGTTTLLGS